MLGQQDRLEDLSSQNMYTIPIGVPNDGFQKLLSVSNYVPMQVRGDHYIDIDVTGSKGQPDLCRHMLVMPLSSMLSVPRHPISNLTIYHNAIF